MGCQEVKSAAPTREARLLIPHLAREKSNTAFAEAEPAAKAFQDKFGGRRPRCFGSFGAGDGNRTHDIQLGKLEFYL